MELLETALAGVLQIRSRRFADSRGFFAEVYNRQRYAAAGLSVDFVQDNHAFSHHVFTLRGLHYQTAPRAQAKLVCVLQGRVLDVVVDLRRNSPTFAKHLAVELSAAEGDQLFVPVGCAHGYCTLEPNSQVFYKVSDYYSPSHERGILWHDEDLGIAWPCPRSEAVVVERDLKWPRLRDIGRESLF